jgi:HEAT repeat protein
MAHEGAARRRAVTIAGHTGDAETALQALADPDPSVRAAGLGALERLGRLADNHLVVALEDPDIMVRRRAAEIAAMHPDIDLLGALNDPDPRVVEVAAWSCGEHESDRDQVIERLLALAADSEEPLVRESAVAALGAIGDERAVDAIIAACADKPAVRRRAVLALAPFIDDDPENEVGQRVDATIERALEDRDWQVRQAAEDLRRIIAAD